MATDSSRLEKTDTMSDRNASRTALCTAHLRAMHQLFDAQPRILDDPVAALLLAPSETGWISNEADWYRSKDAALLRSHIVLRSRFAEDRLAGAVSRGIKQYILLGAGFDTFVLRQPAWARTLKIIEIDHRGTQMAKRSRIAAACLAMPENTKFADVDFENESLADGMRKHGISLAEPTFFSWLGVTMYLEKAAINAVLRTVAAFPSGSEIVLTFLPKPESEAPLSSLSQRVARVGEPFLTAFAPEEIETALRTAGFDHIGFLSSAEAEERYFRHRTRDLPAPHRTGIAYAIR
jgi:methyltransferase (TIGR00027 family)